MQDEKYQYLSLSNASKALSVMFSRQKLRSQRVTQTRDSKNKFELGSKTPMDMKVYALTRWWRSTQDPVKDKAMLCEVGADCQKVDTLFCSLGFEPKAGQCKAEYARVRGRRVPDKWKIQMNASMTTDL